MLGRIIETLSILLAAKLLISEGKPDVPLPVHGIINQSVDLTVPVDRTGSELEIFWTFQTFVMAHFTNNQLRIRNEKFKNRTEALDNGSTLRISNLRKEDGGIYTVSINFADKKIYETSYNLTVYGGRSPYRLIVKPVQCVLFLVPLIIFLTITVKGPQVSSENTDVVSYEETIC